MVFGLPTSTLLFIIAIILIIVGFVVKRLLKWFLIIGLVVLVVAGYFKFF